MSNPRQPRIAADGAQPLDAGLYIVATPIGNLRDVTLRALDVLAGVDVVLAEDTRTSRRLMDAYGLTTPLQPYHEHNAAAARPGLIARLNEGAKMALISDAGTPLVSDPGYKLVREAVEIGVQIIPIPGASAPLSALVASGLPTDRFVFAGFAPPKSAARRAWLEDVGAMDATLIVFESAGRLAASLADMAATLGPRQAAVARELTKRHEELRRGDLAQLAAHYQAAGAPKGELVIVIAPPERVLWDDAAVDAALSARLATLGVSRAAAEIAAVSGRARRDVYARALLIADAPAGGVDDRPAPDHAGETPQRDKTQDRDS